MSIDQQQDTHRADVCIIGAGIAGLNALHVASRYLRPDQRIVLVDRNERVGGMWNHTYDYVHLHQPHPFFTAGDTRWRLGAPPHHLAARTEILDHFRHCVDEAAERVRLTELLGHELVGIAEDDDVVTVTCRAADGRWVTVTADRVINAVGVAVEANRPLAFSSDRVQSVAPETCDMRDGVIAGDDAPVWVVGSGKTGMDALHALITHHPGRQVNLIAGTGTFFIDRGRFYPIGRERWYRGQRPNSFIQEMADRFDGTNEDAVFRWAREEAGLFVTPTADHHFLGLISAEEIERIRAGVGEIVMDHLVDAVDVGDVVRLELKSGAAVDVAPGSWIVNCTSHFDFDDREPEPPYVSASGRVLNVGAVGLFGFSSFSGYFLTHLLFLDKLREVPLWTVDGIDVYKVSPSAGLVSMLTLAQHNLALAADHLPPRVFQQCGLDFDRWYPFPRRFVGQVRFLVGRKKRRQKYQRALETVGERFGIEVGPLVPFAGVKEPRA